MPLEITARIESSNERHNTIGVFQNGGKAGTLVVESKYADQVLLGLRRLSAIDALRAALVGDGEPTAVDWIQALLVTFRDYYDAKRDVDPESTGLMVGAVENFIHEALAALELTRETKEHGP